jgi:hypothetical protein
MSVRRLLNRLLASRDLELRDLRSHARGTGREGQA